jgi:AraC family transcriptional regulator
LNRVTDHIDAHLAERLDMTQLAGLVGLSRNHFGHAFRQSMGMTLRDFILERRIVRAKALLQNRSISIAQIALAVGFANQSHFTAQFRRRTGVSPGRFRRGDAQLTA